MFNIEGGKRTMEMTLNMPQNYVEIEQEEMMYLEGGWYTNIAIGRGVVVGALKGLMYGISIAACTKAIVAGKLAAILSFGNILSSGIISAIGSVIKYSIDWMCTQVGYILDSSRNGWIGIYIHDKYGYMYTQ